MSESDPGTLSFYDANAEAFADSPPDKEDAAHLAQFMAELPDGAAVCDLGCGHAWASAVMRDAGFNVTSIDGSSGLAAEAKRRFGVDVQVMRFEDFAFQEAFDGLWAAWSIHHAPRVSIPALLERVGKAVRPGGVLFIAMKGGSGEKRDAIDRHYAYHGMDELVGLIDAQIGADVLVSETRDGPGFDGSITPLHSLIVRKRAAS